MIQNISAIVAVAAAVFAFAQVLVMRSIARADSIKAALDSLYSREMRDHRRTVYTLASKPVDDWTDQEVVAVERVGSDSSRLGFLIKNKHLRGRDFMELWGPRLVVTYAIVLPYIERERLRTGKDEHWLYFEWLARSAFRRMRRRKPWWRRSRWSYLVGQTSDVERAKTDADLKRILDGR